MPRPLLYRKKGIQESNYALSRYCILRMHLFAQRYRARPGDQPRLLQSQFDKTFQNPVRASRFIPLQEQIRRFHSTNARIYLLDAKYDEFHNYEYARKQGAIPLIDCNPRNEKLAREALLERGYDHNGWPYVPYCHSPICPNGLDVSAPRAINGEMPPGRRSKLRLNRDGLQKF